MRRRDWVNATKNLLIPVAPTRVVDQSVDRLGDLLLSLLSGESLVFQFAPKLIESAFEHFADAVQDLASVVSCSTCPATLCFACGLHRVSDVFSRAEADVT